MTSKIHVNLSQGIFEVEGTEQFVSSIYADFKDQVVAKFGEVTRPADDSAEEKATNARPKAATRNTRRRSAKASATESPTPGPYTPRLLKELDIKGLDEFYAQYSPKNHPERILIFAKFLQEKGVKPITADHIYTCFLKADGKNVPRAYLQALVDTRGKNNGYISYDNLNNIDVPHLGEHHFLTKIKRVGEKE